MAKRSSTSSRATSAAGKRVDAPASSDADLGFEKHLWEAADALHSNTDAAEYDRYVGAEEALDDGVPFEEKMAALTGELATLTDQGADLDKAIAAIGFAFKSTGGGFGS